MNLTFDEILKAVENLTFDEKEKLVDTLKNRQTQYRRRELLNDVKVGRKEYINGKVKKGNSSELMKEFSM